jgi:hypothetical protein
MTTVPPPKADPLDEPAGDVTPRRYPALVARLMEARDCGKPAAETWIADHGRDAAEKRIRARWTFRDTAWGGSQ